MTQKFFNKTNLIIFTKTFIILYCIGFLKQSDAYYTPYIATGLAGLSALFYNHNKNTAFNQKYHKILACVFGVFFGIMVVLANYHVFLYADFPFFEMPKSIFVLYKIVSFSLVFAGTFIIFCEIMKAISHASALNSECKFQKQTKLKDWQVFLLAWLPMLILNTVIFWGARYPAIMSPDSIQQLLQIFRNSYSNHHPYYHTQIIKLMMNIGGLFFDDLSARIATYSIFSITVMTLTFAYVVLNVHQLKRNLYITIPVFLYYFLMPFHIIFSFTMWKDVFFGATVTLFSISTYRILKSMGRYSAVNYVIMTLSALGMCLLRSNGFLAFVASAVIFAVLFMKKHLKSVAIFSLVIVAAYILKNPVLASLNVTQPDTIESLAISTQQIARVVTDGCELTDQQRELLSTIIDIDEIPKEYDPIIVDPVKRLVRDKGNQQYLVDNKDKFIKLYIDLGLKYPHKYLEAWIDQTKGYWNGGYYYWIWNVNHFDEELGIPKVINSYTLYTYFPKYAESFREKPVLNLFVSIGIHIWLILLATYAALCKKDRAALFTSIPYLMTVGTLLVATPVYSEFRYIYAVFCAIPFILLVSFMSGNLHDGN